MLLDPASRRPVRWLLGAAAASVAIGALVVTLDDDGQRGGTAPQGRGSPTSGPAPAVVVYAAPGGCEVGILGTLPGPVTEAPSDAVGDGAAGTKVAGALNATQRFEVQVPGEVVIDLVGERVGEVRLRRGPAEVWFQPAAVQVRWSTGSTDPCESFTVTVDGGSEDGNRYAAIELAERVRLPSELAGTPSSTRP